MTFGYSASSQYQRHRRTMTTKILRRKFIGIATHVTQLRRYLCHRVEGFATRAFIETITEQRTLSRSSSNHTQADNGRLITCGPLFAASSYPFWRSERHATTALLLQLPCLRVRRSSPGSGWRAEARQRSLRFDPSQLLGEWLARASEETDDVERGSFHAQQHCFRHRRYDVGRKSRMSHFSLRSRLRQRTQRDRHRDRRDQAEGRLDQRTCFTRIRSAAQSLGRELHKWHNRPFRQIDSLNERKPHSRRRDLRSSVIRRRSHSMRSARSGCQTIRRTQSPDILSGNCLRLARRKRRSSSAPMRTRS